MSASSHILPPSDVIFDFAVYSAGYAGFSAARQLTTQGHRVLLIEPSGDLLWESSRALENTTTGGAKSWQSWLEPLQLREGIRGHYFDAPLAEITAAHALLHLPTLSTLLYAIPVATHVTADALVGLTVATKSGFRHLRARRWLDASESAALTSLTKQEPLPPPPAHATLWQSAVMYSSSWSDAASGIEQFKSSHPECLWQESFRPEERRLSWPSAGSPHDDAHTLQLLRAFRDSCPHADIFISHLSTRAFPKYRAAQPDPLPTSPRNLLSFSPAISPRSASTPGDRFEWGHSAASEILTLPAATPEDYTFPSHSPAPHRDIHCDVLVVGAGTAGAIAAIAASRRQAHTIAIDSGHTPGGIGTAGGITGYFHGAKGGLQDEVDHLTASLSAVFTGRTGTPGAGWHHAAKSHALAHLFASSGTHFLPDTVLCSVERDASGRILSVLAAQEASLLRITAHAFIDSTGDGDLAALAGARFTMGRTGDGRSLAFSQPAFSLRRGEHGFRHHTWNYDAGWVDPTDPQDLSRARLQGLALYLTDHWTPATSPITIVPLLGLRQSRHITTETELSLADLIDHRTFPDSIGLTSAVADTHSVDFEFESDQALFYLWICRGFRHRLHADMPYGMMLPRSLENVWVACRAAGVTVEAAYCVRMQRDMQRLGEAAGLAAALSLPHGGLSRRVDLSHLQSELDATGARQPLPLATDSPAHTDLLTLLDEGKPGIHLWTLYREFDTYRDELLQRLHRTDASAFYAAAIIAMHADPRAEPRLLAAIQAREVGPHPEEKSRGAFGQVIDIPFWLLAVALLRLCGTSRSLPALRGILDDSVPFNVLTTIALTLERLLLREGSLPGTSDLLALLEEKGTAKAFLPPSRSLWKTLHQEEQRHLPNVWSTDTRQDHSWQMRAILARIHQHLAERSTCQPTRDLATVG